MRRGLLALAAVVAFLLPGAAGADLRNGPQSILVIAGTWGPQPFPTTELRQSVLVDANRFVQHVSFGKASLTGDVTPWLTVKQFNSCDLTAQGDIAVTLLAAARAAGYDPNAFSRFVFVVPLPAGCNFLGFGAENEVWLFGTSSQYVVDHELGHTFGLPHAFSIACKTCRTVEYGDPYDEMGHGHGHYNAWEKAQIGWLTGVTTISASGRYVVDQLEQASEQPQALVIDTARNEYWIDHREPLLEDAVFAGTPLVEGIEVHASPSIDDRGESVFQPRNVLVLNPTGDGTDAIRPGKSWGENGAFRLTVVAHAGTTVSVDFRWTDTTPPGRVPVYSPTGTVRSRKLDVEWGKPTENGSGTARYEVRLDGRLVGTVDAAASRKVLVTKPRKRGRHLITVTAVDRAGNRSKPGPIRFSTR